jgi:predicted carbohydrate-binding protein with CBM5 and CBM33 domain
VDSSGALYVVDYYTIRKGSIASDPITVFTIQPQSQTVNSGNSVTFTVAASGSPTPSYQWRKDGAVISGATTSSYTIASVSSSDAGSYTVTATNNAGTVTSNAAALTLITPPSNTVITFTIQ